MVSLPGGFAEPAPAMNALANRPEPAQCVGARLVVVVARPSNAFVCSRLYVVPIVSRVQRRRLPLSPVSLASVNPTKRQQQSGSV